VRRYDKLNRTPAMHYIDYGLGVLDAGVARECAEGTAFDLAELYGGLAGRGMLAGYEIRERFYEIGSPAGLAETDAFIRRVSTPLSGTRRD
jgi:hypothetical protein